MRKNAVVIKPTETNSYYKQCGKKAGYSKKIALEKAKAAAKMGRFKRMGVYECTFCNKWHLTHIKEYEKDL